MMQKVTTPVQITKDSAQKAYMEFDKNMQINGFQFSEGETYEEPEYAPDEKSFDASTMPLDALSCWASGNDHIYREVDLIESYDDRPTLWSRVPAKKLRIGAELGFSGLVDAQIEWAKAASGFGVNAGSSKASADKQGAASAVDEDGVAFSSGDWASSCATGARGVACASGYQGAACASGSDGCAFSAGWMGAACATGGRSVATGESGIACSSGYLGSAHASGFWGAACTTGSSSPACASGEGGTACAAGFWSNANVTGEHGVALASGPDGKVKGALGCALFAVERDRSDDCTILSVASAIVDGEIIKPDTWYICKGGKLVEA